MTRELDVVVYGATGFTGELVAEYLAAVPGVRWAIAGRSVAKLEAVRGRLAAKHAALASLQLIEASAEDEDSLLTMAARTQVVITTVGPYAKHGEPLVRACVEAGTDYVDLTGEPAFVDAMIGRYHKQAEARGVRIVNTCGFDSVPHDLGAMHAVRTLAEGGELSGDVTVDGYVLARGDFSGGTWHSAVNAMGSPGSLLAAQKERRLALPRSGRPVKKTSHLHHVRRLQAWACPLPTIDVDVVLRSAALLDGYGATFSYGHHVLVKSLLKIAGGAAAIGGIMLLAQLPPTRALLLKVRAPGEGPPPERRAKNWFRVTFVARTGDREVVTEVSGGDPGYGETAKMLAECGLCLALDRDKLPKRAGVLTPAVAMGEQLLPRLERAGIRFAVLS